jgi:hypothetical protein
LSSTLCVTGAATSSSTLAVTQAATFSATLRVAQATALTGAATLSSTVAVTGAATLSSTPAVTQAATFSATLRVAQTTTLIGAGTLHGRWHVVGNAFGHTGRDVVVFTFCHGCRHAVVYACCDKRCDFFRVFAVCNYCIGLRLVRDHSRECRSRWRRRGFWRGQ